MAAAIGRPAHVVLQPCPPTVVLRPRFRLSWTVLRKTRTSSRPQKRNLQVTQEIVSRVDQVRSGTTTPALSLWWGSISGQRVSRPSRVLRREKAEEGYGAGARRALLHATQDEADEYQPWAHPFRVQRRRQTLPRRHQVDGRRSVRYIEIFYNRSRRNPRSATNRRFSSCKTGSRLSMSGK